MDTNLTITQSPAAYKSFENNKFRNWSMWA